MTNNTTPPDFEKTWQAKLASGLDKYLKPEDKITVLLGVEELEMSSPALDKAVWTCGMFNHLEGFVDEKTRQEILVGCACHYPKEDLADAQELYRETGDVDQVIAALQTKFEGFLRNVLELDKELVLRVKELGWGLAGRRDGNRIIATKIPKSGYLVDYFQTEDPLEKRKLYCHCPRVRDMVGDEPQLPKTYCYCGAGFYQGIWETILDQPIEVEVLESVMEGGDVCQIAVHLPKAVTR